MRYDSKFNFITVKIVGKYVEFRARQTNADKTLTQPQVNAIRDEVWQQIESLVGSSIVHIIMVLLQWNPKRLEQCVLYHPLFKKAHEIIERQTKLLPGFPRTLRMILTLLFYKLWLEMCTSADDTSKHVPKALAGLNLCGFTYFEKDDPEIKKYVHFFDIDDKFYHKLYYRLKVL